MSFLPAPDHDDTRARLARAEAHYDTFPDTKLMLASVAIDRVMERRRLLKVASATSGCLAAHGFVVLAEPSHQGSAEPGEQVSAEPSYQGAQP